MLDAGVGDDRGGVHPVGVAGPQGHDAVGGEQDGRGDVLKLPLLVLPRGAEVALQVGVALLQLRVAVGGQHLRVGVHVDAFARSLFQQAFHIVEIVAGNDDERPFLDDQRHLHRFRLAEGTGVGGVQQLHAAVAGLAGLLHQRPERVDGALAPDGLQRLTEKAVQLRIDAAQHPRVVVVGPHPAQTEQHEGLQAADVFVRFVPELLHIVVEPDAGARGVNGLGQLVHGLRVKVYVGDGGEQPFHQQQGLFRGRGPPFADKLPGVGDECAGQPVLRRCGLGAFAADPGFPRTGRAVGRLFALKTKHRFVHFKTLSSLDVVSMDGVAGLYTGRISGRDRTADRYKKSRALANTAPEFNNRAGDIMECTHPRLRSG